MKTNHENHAERGSAMLLAILMLFILTATGASLIFLSESEITMSRADSGSKRVFYVAEGGLEDGRATLYQMNMASPSQVNLTEELVVFAGLNGVFDFDPATLAPIYDVDGNLTGYTGFGDDVPIRGLTDFAGGRYMTFVTNDHSEGVTTTADVNQRVLMTSVGVDRNNATEMVQALVFRPDTHPSLPAAITILGPDATFEGGNSAAKDYVGDEDNPICPGGDPAVSKPVVAVVGTASKELAEDGVKQLNTYVSGGDSGTDTVFDLKSDANMDPIWEDCEALIDLAETIKLAADVVGDSSTDPALLGTPGAPKVAFIDGDYSISGNWDGGGLLLVTGELELDGMTGWAGPIFVIGKGDFLRDGAGTGNLSGGIVVADVAGPDRTLFTSDDCTGEDGLPNTSDDGIAGSTYLVNGDGNSTTAYCGKLFPKFQGLRPFAITAYRQM